jgi:outer membrane receptor protein involved in Fe transport
VSQCIAGAAQFCADMVYDQTLEPPNYPGALTEVITQPQNAATETTSGLDFQADYTMDLFAGSLAWHLIGNYTDELTLNAPGLYYDSAGAIGGNNLVGGGDPKFKGTLAATYSEGPFSGTIQTRMEGAAVLNNYWASGINVDQNTVPFNAYLDLRASYRWSPNVQFFGAIDNALDTPPPAVPIAAVGGGNAPAASNAYSNLETRTDLYDALGRTMRIGVRFQF